MLPLSRADTTFRSFRRTQSNQERTPKWRSVIWLTLLGVTLTGIVLIYSFVAVPKGSRTHAGSRARRLQTQPDNIVELQGTAGPVLGSGATDTAVPLLSRKTARTALQRPLTDLTSTTDSNLTALPDGFDWQSYLVYHPDLKDAGILSRPQAEEHYRQFGVKQKLLYKRIHVVMRYTACTGLVNQLYSHIAALALAAHLGAEVILPPAAKRDSFAHYFSVFKEQNEVLWSADPLESLLNVDYLIDFWAKRGMTVTRARALEPFPDLTEPENAFVGLALEGEGYVARMGGVYQQHLEMNELVDRARRTVVNRAEELLAAGSSAVDRIVLDLPCTFFMLRCTSNTRLVAEVAKSLQWSPKVQRLADKVVGEILADSKTGFNSVHLRMEKDARDWAKIMGGSAVMWSNYVDTMREAGFNGGQGLYIASGLLTYGAKEELEHLIATMKESGLCSTAHYKEMYLPQSEIDDLNSEQKALLDLLVLAKGYSFVGFGSSTFSFYLREYRSLMGIPPARSILVDASVIGTDSLFEEAGRIT